MPAGPLRESIKRGLSRTNLIVVIGEITEYLKKTIPDHIPVIPAKFNIFNESKIFKGQTITAFAGIAYPEKFFSSLREQGAKVVKEIIYPDHHIYDENDLLYLKGSIPGSNNSEVIINKAIRNTKKLTILEKIEAYEKLKKIPDKKKK